MKRSTIQSTHMIHSFENCRQEHFHEWIAALENKKNKQDAFKKQETQLHLALLKLNWSTNWRTDSECKLRPTLNTQEKERNERWHTFSISSFLVSFLSSLWKVLMFGEKNVVARSSNKTICKDYSGSICAQKIYKDIEQIVLKSFRWI